MLPVLQSPKSPVSSEELGAVNFADDESGVDQKVSHCCFLSMMYRKALKIFSMFLVNYFLYGKWIPHRNAFNLGR